MKKLIKWFLILAGIFAVLFAIIFYYPKEIDIETSGIKYRLGKDHMDFEQQVEVVVRGTIYKTFPANKRFNGIIEIENTNVPIDEVYKKLDINLNKDNSGLIMYFPYQYVLGTIYFNKLFDKLTITLMENETDKSKSWYALDGLMVTAPAQDRNEAISMSNDIMSEYLNGYNLQ